MVIMKKVFVIFSLFTFLIKVSGQSFVAEAPSQVSVGEQFRLTYKINTQNVSGFKIEKMPDELEILIGPSTSSQSSFQIINGHTTSTSSITYTYILCANKNGNYDIPKAQIVANGKRITSNAIKIHVVGNYQNKSNSTSPNRGNTQQAAGTRISNSDLFIKVTANKKKVYEQEPVLLTYKVYTLVDLTQLEGKMPDLKGFYSQEVKLPQQKSFKIETINGRPYRTVTGSQYVMFPQKTGKLDIPSLTFNGVVVLSNRSVDPFEAFFNGGSGYIEVKQKITAPGVTIDVEPLPTRPADFSGGVGSFTINGQLNKNTTKANEPVSIKVTIKGVGNLKLIKAPSVQFPKDFDKFDPKITDNTKLTTNGIEGSYIYDYLAIPRHPGKYEIPPIELTYFDTLEKGYKTIRTKSFVLNVEKGDKMSSTSNYTGQEDLKQLNNDIRFIKTGKSSIHEINDFFFGSYEYIISIIIILSGFTCLLVILRKRTLDSSNIGKIRGKKANKLATKRLKFANKLMCAKKQKEFYDEVLRALWGYIGDKLNMPIERISKENISSCLTDCNISEETIKEFISVIDECEYERYAPGDVQGNMNKTYEAALSAIMNIENTMKKKTHSRQTLIWIVIFLVFYPYQDFALTKSDADNAYINQKYGEAIKTYEELLTTGVSSDLYYNLGNAYYRTENITRAILNYERALLLSPGDTDIRFNLQMARSKTIDKIVPESEMFFVTWYRTLINIMSVDAWARTSLISLSLFVLFILLYLFSSKIVLRKVGFFNGILFFIVFISSVIFAYQQRKNLVNRTGAIVTSPSITVKSTPADNGTDLFILHEGTKVLITDDSIKNWIEIRLADGKIGWIKSTYIELI